MQASEREPGFRPGGALLTGALLILALVPVLQWLGRGAAGSSAELDAPGPIAVGALVAMLAIAALLRLLGASRKFEPRALILVYVMLSASIPFCNFGLVQGFFASITAVAGEYLDRRVMTIQRAYEMQDPDFFPKVSEPVHAEYRRLMEATRDRPQDAAVLRARQAELILPLKRFWSGVAVDPDAKARLDHAHASVAARAADAWRAIPWTIWRPVLVCWGALFGLVLTAVLMMGRGLARDWIDRENLPFPAAQLPLGLIESSDPHSRAPGSDMSRNPFFWGGFGIAAILLLLSGISHYHILNLPLVAPVTFERIDFRAIFVSPPWNVLADNLLLISPLMIGLALLVHQDILKGCLWVFGILMVVRLAAGIGEAGLRDALGEAWPSNGFPYFRELGTGAMALFALVTIARNRAALFGSRRRAMGWLAVSGLIVAWWYRQGVSGGMALVFLFFVAVWTILGGVAVARARAEGGLTQGGANFSGSEFAFNTGNVSTYGLANILAFNHSFFLTISMLPGLLASTMEGCYLARRFRLSFRAVFTAVAVGFAVALAAGMLSFLLLSYSYGAQNMQLFLQRMARFPFYDTFMGGDVTFQSGRDAVRAAMVPAGAVLMGALLWIRRRQPRFPIAPVSFLVICLGTITFQRAGDGLHALQLIPINVVWGPILIAWILKGMILRYGGMDLYVRTRPAALGLVFGHAVMILAWNIYHAVASPDTMLFTGVFQ